MGSSDLLVILRVLPYPPVYGSRMRTWSLLRALAENGYRMRLLALGTEDELDAHRSMISAVCPQSEVVPHYSPSISTRRDYFRRLTSLVSPLPYGVDRFSSASMRKRIAARLRENAYSAVLCDSPYLVTNLPDSLSVPVIITTQNVEHMLLYRYWTLEKNPLKRTYAWLEWLKFRRWECSVCSRASMLLVCSEVDRSSVMELCPGIPVVVLPNTIEVDRYEIAATDTPGRILYFGEMDWHPNRDAVEFFVTKILPYLRGQVPEVRFAIAGRGPTEEYRRRFARFPDVEVIGEVPDIRSEIAKAALCVVPLRIGSGTRLKILEAAAMGKAVVSTRLGAEGLEFTDGVEIVLADSPESFAQAVADLLGNPVRRHELGKAARRRVERQYSFAALRVAMNAAFAELCSKRRDTT